MIAVQLRTSAGDARVVARRLRFEPDAGNDEHRGSGWGPAAGPLGLGRARAVGPGRPTGRDYCVTRVRQVPPLTWSWRWSTSLTQPRTPTAPRQGGGLWSPPWHAAGYRATRRHVVGLDCGGSRRAGAV